MARSPPDEIPRGSSINPGIGRKRRDRYSTTSWAVPEMGRTVQAAVLKAKAPRVMETADVDAEKSGVVDTSSEACLGVAAAWSGAVGGLLLVMLLVCLFS